MASIETWKIIVISICIALFITLSLVIVYYFFLYIPVQPTDIEKSIPSRIDEGFNTTPISTYIKKDAGIYSQPSFAVVNTLNTALSPPRNHQPSYPLPNLTSENPKPRTLFSLSPLEDTPSSNIESLISHHTVTPALTNEGWRGPTPPWTQHPGR